MAEEDIVPSWLDAEYMQEVLRTPLNKPNLIVDHIDVKPAAKVGENFAGLVFRITVHFQNHEEMSVIAKLKGTQKLITEISSEYDLFKTEAHFFGSILPRLEKVYKQQVPLLYHIDYKREIILMEDLKASGFYLIPVKDFLNLEETKLVMEAMAILHGASYSVFEEDPGMKETYKKNFWQDLENFAIKGLIENGFDSLEKWVGTYGLSEAQTKKLLGLRGYVRKNWEKMYQRRDSDLDVLSHGDIWLNNLMFHKNDDVIDAVTLIDFQLLCFCSCGFDLQFTIFGCVQSDLIVNNLDQILHFYFDKLKEVAPGIPNLTFERIKSQFNQFYILGIVSTFLFRAYAVSEEAIDMDNFGNGKIQDAGFRKKSFITEAKMMMEFLEKNMAGNDLIPEWLNAGYIQVCLSKYMKNSNLIVDRIEVNPASSVGTNYCGLVFRVTVYLRNNTKMSVIAKLKRDSEAINAIFDEFDLFKIEAHFFETVLPRLNSVQRQPVPMLFNVDYEKEVILMEDLKTSGFHVLPLDKFLNLEETKVAIEALAMLHGASYSVFEKDPSLKEKYEKQFWGNLDNSANKGIIGNGFASLEKWARTYGLTQSQSEKLIGLSTKIRKNWHSVFRKNEGELFVLLHGDAWMNNLMFKKDENDTNEIRLIDFQLISYSSFAIDLQFLIFGSAQTDLIINDLDQLLTYYYERLQDVAPGIPNLTFERIKKEFSDRYIVGLLLAFIFRAYCVGTRVTDLDNFSEGVLRDSGFRDGRFIGDVKRLVPFFENIGAI